MACSKSTTKSLHDLCHSKSHHAVNQIKLVPAAAVTFLTGVVALTFLSLNATTVLTEVFRGFPQLLQ